MLVAASILVRVANYEKGKTNKNKRTPPRSSPPPPHPPRLKRDCRPAPSQQLPSSIRKSIIKKWKLFQKLQKCTKDTVSTMKHIRATATFHNDVHGCSLNLFSWHFQVCHVCYVYIGCFFAVPIVWRLVCLATPRPPR